METDRIICRIVWEYLSTAQNLEPDFESEVMGIFPDGAAVGSFSTTSNQMDYLPFSAKKYGESSYYLTFDRTPAGEYGIIVSNPNNVDEKMVIVSTFAIDEAQE